MLHQLWKELHVIVIYIVFLGKKIQPQPQIHKLSYVSFQVFCYSKGIFDRAGVQAEHIQYAVVGTNFVNVFMTIIAVSTS